VFFLPIVLFCFLLSFFLSELYKLQCTFLSLAKILDKELAHERDFLHFQAGMRLAYFYKSVLFTITLLLFCGVIISIFYLIFHLNRYKLLQKNTINVKKSLGISPKRITYELFREHFVFIILSSTIGLIIGDFLYCQFSLIFPTWISQNLYKGSYFWGNFDLPFVVFLFLFIFIYFNFSKIKISKEYKIL
jgi:ABC-type antimicrobial peptide transport system permease subunit